VTDEKATEQRTEERLRRWASSANSRCSAEGSNTTRAVLLVRHAAPPPPQGHPVRALPSSVRLRGGYKTKSAPPSSHNTLSRAQQPPNTSKSFQDLLSDSSMCLATQQQVPAPPHQFPHHTSFARFIFGRARVSQTPPCHSIASRPPPTTCDRSPPLHQRTRARASPSAAPVNLSDTHERGPSTSLHDCSLPAYMHAAAMLPHPHPLRGVRAETRVGPRHGTERSLWCRRPSSPP
jgi:hypothetical protein